MIDVLLNRINSDNDLFYCLDVSRIDDFDDFVKSFNINRPEGANLVRFLKEFSLYENNLNLSKTYLVIDKTTDEVAGYFSLKAGTITLNGGKYKKPEDFDAIPGIEISNFAANDVYRKAHGLDDINFKIGKSMFINFILPIINEVSKVIGVNNVYIFALPEKKLIDYYKNLGFERLSEKSEEKLHSRIRPFYDQNCIFMWQRLAS